MSARSGGQTFDLRCEVREKLIYFLQKDCPEALPRSRQISVEDDGDGANKRREQKSRRRAR
jgi:hypothetical protein